MMCKWGHHFATLPVMNGTIIQNTRRMTEYFCQPVGGGAQGGSIHTTISPPQTDDKRGHALVGACATTGA
eukprot:758244-Pleurochrysis_carterae.AAC.1